MSSKSQPLCEQGWTLMGWWSSVVCGVLFEILLSLTNNQAPHPCMFYRAFVSLRSFEMAALCDSLYGCFSVHFEVEETDRKTFWDRKPSNSPELQKPEDQNQNIITSNLELVLSLSLSPCLCFLSPAFSLYHFFFTPILSSHLLFVFFSLFLYSTSSSL